MGDVCDEDGSVRGVSGLYVADAQVVGDVVRIARTKFEGSGESFEKLARVAASAVVFLLSFVPPAIQRRRARRAS